MLMLFMALRRLSGADRRVTLTVVTLSATSAWVVY
jgi:hypothetical protein